VTEDGEQTEYHYLQVSVGASLLSGSLLQPTFEL
jgi:hypothetical protein